MPRMMKALLLYEQSGEGEEQLRIESIPVPKLADGEALVRIRAAALNHRDEWIREGKYAKIKYPLVPGSDGCGVVEDVAGGHEELIGKEVVINPAFEWGDDPKAQSREFHILGMPTNGTFAEYVVISADRLHPKPVNMSVEEAASLPLGGLTAYRAVITQAKVQEDERVLVTGIGGGVAQIAFQFAQALGAVTYVTSGDEEKLRKAEQIGAYGGINYHRENWDKQLLTQSGGFDVVIDSAGGDQMNALLNVLKPGGRYISYGATLGRPSSLNVQKIFWNQLTIQGTTMGTDEEFVHMMQFVRENAITPIVDSVFPFEQADAAFERMKEGQQFGKIVLRMNDRSYDVSP